MIDLAAVLLAGGRSRRMGQDKALLPLPYGRLLWERQWAVLQALKPNGIFVSGPRRREFPEEIRCLEDLAPGQGPLGGIMAALAVMGQQTHLVVLAVDLPQMTAGFLHRLLSHVKTGCGAVPRQADDRQGFYEPLAAVYPAGSLPVAREYLQSGERSMQGFIRQLGALVCPVIIREEEKTLFSNWNTPADRHG